MGSPKLLVFASGTATKGGSGFENLVEASDHDAIYAEIVGVVSNHANGGVRERADRLKIPFTYFPGPWTPDHRERIAAEYQRIAAESGADFFPLSGWLKQVLGLDLNTPFNPRTVFNIHPGPLPRFGGKGMHGHYVHEAVMAAYERGEVTHSEVCMHFVDEKYDHGPIFFRCSTKIEEDDTADSLGKRLNRFEHNFQPEVTDLVVNGHIGWDGINPESLVVPDDYEIERAA